MKKIGVIIVNYNSENMTLQCIESLKKSFTYCYMQIIVVDNCSSDTSFNNLKKNLEDSIILERTDINGGFSYGNNIGIKIAIAQKCSFILLLNNDTEVSPDFLEYLIDALEQNENIGIVAPKILFYDKPEIIWSKGGKINWMYAGENGCLNKKNDNDLENISAKFLTGCCLLFRTQLVERVGYLSEEYFMYYEDVDFSDRVVSEGYTLMCIPKSVIYHKIGSSSGGDKSPFSLEWSVRSHNLFIQKKIDKGCKIRHIKYVVFVRDFIRVLYFAIFKSIDQALAIWHGMTKNMVRI